ncbi:MAG: hypothetical protein C0519_09775 [Hyphomicrobium sp.]|nr:hypothetical protein [Hyphomicrobium sp.]
MTHRLANIEPVARALCARELQRHNPEDAVPSLVERYWRVTAALLEAGLIDEAGQHITYDYEQGQAAWIDWLSRQ